MPTPSIDLPTGSLQPTEAPTQAPTQAPTEAPTQAPTTKPPTQAPTTPPPTQAPTSPPTVEPSSQPPITVQPTIVVTVTLAPTVVTPSPAAGTDSSSTSWIWLLIAAAVIALIVALVLRGRSGKDAWKDQAKLAITNGEALYHRLADELSVASVAGTVPSGLEESRRMVDLLGGSLAELSQGTLEVGVVTALQDLREKLGALREALESIGAAHLGVHDALAQAGQRLSTFETSLGAFRDRVFPPPPGGTQV